MKFKNMDSCNDFAGVSVQPDQLTASRGNINTIPFKKWGTIHPIQLKVNTYLNGNLAIKMLTWETGYAEPWEILTTNLEGIRKKDCAFININGDPDFPAWLIRYGLAIPTGAVQRSGFCKYPEYRFRADRLKEMDVDGYEKYLRIQKEKYFV